MFGNDTKKEFRHSTYILQFAIQIYVIAKNLKSRGKSLSRLVSGNRIGYQCLEYTYNSQSEYWLHRKWLVVLFGVWCINQEYSWRKLTSQAAE